MSRMRFIAATIADLGCLFVIGAIAALLIHAAMEFIRGEETPKGPAEPIKMCHPLKGCEADFDEREGDENAPRHTPQAAMSNS